MRRGQIALIPHATTTFQRVIEWVTHSPVHHVVVAVNDTIVVSAEIPRVRFRRATHFPDAIWSHFPLTDRQSFEVAKFAAQQVGKKYALADDILIWVALITRRNTPQWIQDRLSSWDQWQCAELADAALLAASVNVFGDNRPVGAVYPGSFIEPFKAHGWWTLN